MAIRRVNKPIVQREGGDAIFGEGTDSDVTIASGTTTLIKDMYYNNLTVDSGATLFTNGFRVFVKGTFTNNGTVGMPAGTAHSVADGGGTIAGRQTALNPSKAWGTSTDPISATDIYDLDDAISGFFITGTGTVTKIGGGSLGVAGSAGSITAAATGPFAGGAATFPGALAGQAGGAGNAGTAGTAATAGTGGAGGLGGGLVIIFAKTIAGSGTLVSYGYAGSAGGSATQGTAGSAGTTAPNITGYHTSGTYHHPAMSTGPNPGAGTYHPAGTNPHVAGNANAVTHNPGNPNVAGHNSNHGPGHNGNPHGAGHNSNHGSGHNAHTSSHNPNTHVYWSNHNATYNGNHVPAQHFAHGTGGTGGLANHNGTVNKGGNHNPGSGHSPAVHYPGNHNSGHGHHAGNPHGPGHSGNPHPAGHNSNHGSGHNGNPNPAGHNSNHGPGHNGNPHGAGHNSNANTSNQNPHVAGNANASNQNPHVAGNANPDGHTSGTHPHNAATVNVSTGAVTSNKTAAPTTTATNANYTGGTGGAAGAGGTANAGGTGVTGSTGGIIVVTRNAGNATTQIGHSNYSKVIDI